MYHNYFFFLESVSIIWFQHILQSIKFLFYFSFAIGSGWTIDFDKAFAPIGFKYLQHIQYLQLLYDEMIIKTL